ncbi:MAG: DUF1254 domain-containing protein [Candidatus Acidiferrum sp.]
MKPKTYLAVLVISGTLGLTNTQAQTAPKTDIPPEVLKSISIADKVDTPIGRLDFYDGVPTGDTVKIVYDNLDRSRGFGVYLDNLGGVAIHAFLAGLAAQGADAPNKVAIFEQLMDSQAIVLTANTSTLYAFSRTDLANDGPTVIEVPPGMLGFLDDDWERFVGDIGVTGPDRGKGGKYLVLPPGYEGQVPDGYFLLKPRTNKNFLFLRGSIDKGLQAAAENMTSGIRIYPLKDAAKPAPTTFTNLSGKSFNTLFPNTLAYYEHLNQIIQDEPLDAIDPSQRGAIATIGILKGKPFAPDERMKKLLTEAATLGNATARAITFDPRLDGVYFYPDTDSAWSAFFANRNATFESDGTMQLDAAVLYYFNAGGVTPSMAKTAVGVGSDYAGAYLDAKKQPFDGSKTYKVHLPPNVPVNNFWAVTIYDTQTRSQLQTGQRFPTVGSQTKGIEKNADGSFDIYFSPKAPAGKENNWLQTVPGKSWFVILRMYGPLEPWLNKTWRPSEIALVQ